MIIRKNAAAIMLLCTIIHLAPYAEARTRQKTLLDVTDRLYLLSKD